MPLDTQFKRALPAWMAAAVLGLFAGAAASGLPQASPFAGDRSFDRPVTVDTHGEPLGAVLDRLAAERTDPYGHPGTHLALRAARGAEPEPLTIVAREQPLRSVLAGLAELLHADWERQGTEGASRYVLSPGLRVRRYEQALWLETLTRGAEPLFRLAGYLERPAEYYRRLEAETFDMDRLPADPLLQPGNGLNLASLRSGPRRAMLELLTTFSPEQRFALLEGERYVLRGAAMDERQRRLVAVIARDLAESRVRYAPSSGKTVDDWIRWIQEFGLVLHVTVHPVTGAVIGYGVGEGGAVGHVAAFPETGVALDLLPVRGNPYERRTPDKPPTYPELSGKAFPREFRLASGERLPWSDVLARLAKHIPIPLFSDAYAAAPSPAERGGKPLPDLGQLSLEAGLDALCDHYRCLWWYRDGALYFRSRTWFIERAFVVPPAVLDSVRRSLAKEGRLDPAGLDRLASLTERQLVGLNARAGLDSGALGAADSREYRVRMGRREARVAHGYLQVYATLTPKQKAQVLTPAGLPFAGMSPDQRERFSLLLALEYGPEMLAAPERLRLAVEQKTRTESTPEGTRRVVDLSLSCRAPAANEAPIAERLSVSLSPAGGDPTTKDTKDTKGKR